MKRLKKRKLLSFEELMQEQELVEFEVTTQEESRQYILNILLAGIFLICLMVIYLERLKGTVFIMCLIAAGLAIYLLKWNNLEAGGKNND